MTQNDYKNKKRECWEEFKVLNSTTLETTKQAFDWIWDRAYAIGKDKETITQEEIEKAAKKYAAEVDKNVRDLYGIEDQPASLTFGECAAESFREGAKFALGKQDKDADTVIQGWVARDEDGRIYLYDDEPKRENGKPYGKPSEWVSENIMTKLSVASFPDLTWESDPQPVEIIIKRKKNG